MLRPLFAALLLASPLLAAPVPPARPAELTKEGMVGAWEYEYASHFDGTLHLFADHTYVAWHAPHAATWYHGFWYVDGNALHLREWSAGGACATNYTFHFRAADWPYLDGQCGAVRVSLRR